MKQIENDLEALWENEVLPLAYDLEEAFLDVLRKKQQERNHAGLTVSAMAVATAHILQVLEQMAPEPLDLKTPYLDVFNSSHQYYTENPTEPDIPMMGMGVGIS